jgi:hypothetical protein
MKCCFFSVALLRYDCRGYLYDLTEHDADLLDKSGKLIKANEEDVELEKLCDEERYSALNKLLEEEQLRQGLYFLNYF